MAGVTNYPFRNLCRSYGAALFVSEMSLASSILSPNNPRARFGAHEQPRSAQIYATDAGAAAAAAAVLIARDGVRHIDLNFGCPAPKVLRKGGGAALAADAGRLGRIVAAVVEEGRADGVAVTVKLRAGVTAGALTYERAGREAEMCGAAAVTLHARTAEEGYARGAGRRGWGRIRRLSEALGIPVVGNGDVFTARDAVEMMRETGAAGVAVGRGCLGRPWLFGDLVEAFEGGEVRVRVPGWEEVRAVMMKHVEEGVEWGIAVRDMRKWYKWYLQGYVGVDEVAARLCKAESVEEVREVLWGVKGEAVKGMEDVVVQERGKVGGR